MIFSQKFIWFRPSLSPPRSFRSSAFPAAIRMLSANIWSRSLHLLFFYFGLSLRGRRPTLKKYQGEKVDKPRPVPRSPPPPDVIRLFIQPFIPEQSGEGGSHRSAPPPPTPTFFRPIVMNWNELMMQFDYGEFRLKPKRAQGGGGRPTGHRRREEGPPSKVFQEDEQKRNSSVESLSSR